MSFHYPGKPFTASVSVDVISLSITKTGKLTPALVGDYISYVVTIVVPKDTVAYTPTLTDLLPVGQTYYGPSTVQIPPDLPSPVSPTTLDQNINFPALADITATGADVFIVYIFVTEITSANHIPPYSELQTDTGTVSWAVASGGP